MGWLARLFGQGKPRAFADLLVERLEGDARVASVLRNEAQAAIDVRLRSGASVGINLGNLKLDYERLPVEAREPWLSRLLERVLGTVAGSPAEAPSFEGNRSRLMPAIRGNDFASSAALRSRAGSPAPGRPLETTAAMLRREAAEGLDLMCVVDLPDGLSFVMTNEVEAWGVGPYEVFEAALANLREATREPLRESEGLYVPAEEDSYRSSRALLSDWIGAAPVQGEPLVAIPSRDRLLVGGSADAERLLEETDRLYRSDPRPLSRRLFVSRDGQLEPWSVPGNHPLHGKLRLAALAERSNAYHEQKELLEAIHSAEGIDLFVPKYVVMERQGRYTSAATWTADVHAWLPRAEDIVLVAEGVEPLVVPWAALHEIVGHRLREIHDLRPVRYEVKSYPVRAELEQLRAAAIR